MDSLVQLTVFNILPPAVLTVQMTAKMLNRQATKAHKEADAQKTKVKKVWTQTIGITG
jgi:hypothetical protein